MTTDRTDAFARTIIIGFVLLRLPFVVAAELASALYRSARRLAFPKEASGHDQ